MQLAPTRKYKCHRPGDVSEDPAFSWQQQHIHILWDTDSAQSPFTVSVHRQKQTTGTEWITGNPLWVMAGLHSNNKLRNEGYCSLLCDTNTPSQSDVYYYFSCNKHIGQYYKCEVLINKILEYSEPKHPVYSLVFTVEMCVQLIMIMLL